jgi:hypothetical protein
VAERASAGTDCRAQSRPVTFTADGRGGLGGLGGLGGGPRSPWFRLGGRCCGGGRRPDADSDAAEDGAVTAARSRPGRLRRAAASRRRPAGDQPKLPNN